MQDCLALVRVCRGCGTIVGVRVFHQNTAYFDLPQNLIQLCDDCIVENEEYWAEQWREYYALCM